MQTSLDTRIQSVDRAILTPLVRQALNSDAAALSQWRCQPIHEGIGLGTVIYRFSGTAQVQSEKIEWSLILKVLLEQAGQDNPTAWYYWKREAEFYRSEWITELPHNTRPAKCFAVSERLDEVTGKEYWLWLEDVAPEPDSQWSLEDYHQVARHLGRFNGSYLVERSLPSAPWLNSTGIRNKVEYCVANVGLVQQNRDNPIVRRWLRHGKYEELMQWVRERELYCEMLDWLPQTLCHFDAIQGNLFLKRDGSGIIAIDWSYVGYGAIGSEIHMPVLLSLLRGQVDFAQGQDLDQAVFNGYLSGLHDVGWQGNSDLARLGYAATAIYPGISTIEFITDFVLDENRRKQVEQAMGVTVEELADPIQKGLGIVSALLQEARELRRKLA